MEFAKQLGQSAVYGGLQQAGAALQEAREGELSRLERSLKGLYELRARLVGINNSLRGARPEPTNVKEGVPERSLVNMTSQIISLVEQCHCELNETNELLQ